jgi:RecJ-like exonuclease
MEEDKDLSGPPTPEKPIDAADTSDMGSVRDFPEETLCPSCGRFVGAYEKCPYCGAELKKRTSLRLWKRIAVGGAVAGLLLMWLAATKMEPKLLQVADITATYNNAIVKIQGMVVGRSLEKERGMVKMRVNDGSSTVSVLGFGVLPKLKKLGNLPRVGDRIELVGQVQISDQYGTSLFLNLPSRLKIMAAPAVEEARIGKLNESWANSRVRVKGNIKMPARFGKATITDGAKDLVVALDPANLGEDIPELKVGDGVEITGVLTSRKGKFVLVPGKVEDIKAVAGLVLKVARKKISEISLKDQGDLVEIEGQAVKFFPFKNGGGSLTVSDGTGKIGVPIFSSVFEQIAGADQLRLAGTRVKIRGR